MNIRVTFKTPDALDEPIAAAARDNRRPAREWCNNDQVEALEGADAEAIRDRLEKWVKYGELVTIEFTLADDPKDDSARVVPRR